MSKSIVLRIQSADGTKRIQLNSSDTARTIYEKVFEVFSLDCYNFILYRKRARCDEVVSTRSTSVEALGLKHGDTLYMEPLGHQQNGDSEAMEEDYYNVPSTSKGIVKKRQENHVENLTSTLVEDDIDKELAKMNSKISRTRDPKLCQHTSKAECVHCAPLDSFDKTYLDEKNIKHMSFHSYLRMLKAGNRGDLPLLENTNCRIKEGCKGHPPWPKGICSKCQPSAITLNRQTYRHVDNIVFENPSIVEDFLNYWRSTGNQRIGFLFGRYDIHADVPLGIKATVVAIYEPPQDSKKDSIELLADEKSHIVIELASKLGLKCVGWIFTDLIAEDVQIGTVKYMRGIETYFLSAEECIMAGTFQNNYPNICPYSPNGHFGSKFVTICVTGDASSQVHMEGYSVTNQCMALVKDGILVPTVDAPELGYIRPSSDKQYVPDVYYKEADVYGNNVLKLARPLPVEYLLVDVPVSTPKDPVYSFPLSEIDPFSLENRFIDGHTQDLSALANYFNQCDSIVTWAMAISNFHVLLFIATNDVLPMMNRMDDLLAAVKEKDFSAIIAWKEENWSEFEDALNSHWAYDKRGSNSSGRNTSGETWTCKHCTFMNQTGSSSCEMCSLPR